MQEFLKGKKTYLIAAAGAVATGVYLLGFVDTDTYVGIMGFLGFGGFAALRAGIKNG